MARLLEHYAQLGKWEARITWIECKDFERRSNKWIEANHEKRHCAGRIFEDTNSLATCLETTEMLMLQKECEEFQWMAKEEEEQKIERMHRPPQIFFNERALIQITTKDIPIDIKIGLSFGPKFLFPYICNDKNLHETLAQLDITISEAMVVQRQPMISKQIASVLKKRASLLEDHNKQWLVFVYKRTREFFELNKDMFATKSDKGGHAVILDELDYERKLGDLLNDKKSYCEIEEDPLMRLIRKESSFIKKLKRDEKLKKELFDGLPLFEPNTLTLAKFYGLVKIHKQGFPLRPITAMIGAVGFLLSKVFDRMLNIVFPRTNYHIKDTYEFVKFINKMKISSKDRLISFDVVSMYTSIPIDLVKSIVLSRSNCFLNLFSLNRADLVAIMDFLLKECTVSTALGRIFKQTSGLPMGSCISPTLARITMDKVVEKLIKDVPQIKFIKVFVDDTIAAMRPKYFEEALKSLNDFCENQIKFTKEVEREDGSIDFLNVTLKRKKRRIETIWYKKEYASGRLLNYFSSHKRSIILATASQYIRTVLLLSDPSSFNDNKEMIENTLRTNSFPETLIVKLMNTYYTYMTPHKNAHKEPHTFYPANILRQHRYFEKYKEKEEKSNKEYIIFPHSICNGREIKKILYENKKDDVVLADSVKNTKLNCIKTKKTVTPIYHRKNFVLIAKCQCKKKTKVSCTKFNENVGMAVTRMTTEMTKCNEFAHAYKKILIKKGLYYSNQTDVLVKYLQWKYRKTLDKNQGFEFPNYHLAKLIKT